MRSRDFEELQRLIKSAELGDAEAQNILGARLITGEGVKQDTLGGLYWYAQAIKQGYVHAKWNAGSMFVDGEEGVEKDLSLGMRLIEEAAEANENSACLFLAHAYRVGSYSKNIDENQADRWDKQAWDRQHFKPFDRPLDIASEYNVQLKKPAIVPID